MTDTKKLSATTQISHEDTIEAVRGVQARVGVVEADTEDLKGRVTNIEDFLEGQGSPGNEKPAVDDPLTDHIRKFQRKCRKMDGR